MNKTALGGHGLCHVGSSFAGTSERQTCEGTRVTISKEQK